MKTPQSLIKGDLISIVAPAKSIDSDIVDYAQDLIVERGFRAKVSTHCKGAHYYYSGTDEDRQMDFQAALNDPEVRAILCARGGYGSVRIFDKLDWSHFKKNPKWIIGFSDITVFHHLLQFINVQSIHATMPLNFKDNSILALDTLFSSINGSLFNVNTESLERNIQGTAKGKLVGGNLSIIYSLLASEYCFDFSNKILFIEDLSEQYYHLDRMLHALKHAGAFNQISGLIVGGMTDMKDTEVSFGMDVYDLILGQAGDLNIPVCFNFPCGHINDNRAMILGADVLFQVSELNVELSYV